MNGRRALREELQSTWNVYEPTKRYPSRKERRANLAEARKMDRALRKRLEQGRMP